MQEKLNSYTSKIIHNLRCILKVYKDLLYNKTFLFSLIIAYILHKICIQISNTAGIIATQSASVPVTDAILSNTTRMNTFFIHGTMSSVFFDYRIYAIFLLLPYAPFALYSLSLLMLTRSVFINLTHLGIPVESIPISSTGTFGGDLFFSGHVAYPLLLMFIFWSIKPLRYFLLLLATAFALGALLGHYHYSIDVFSAPFFAYGIYEVSKRLFSDSYKYLVSYEYLYVDKNKEETKT